MRVPLTDEQQAIESTMPKGPSGHIINPVYAMWPWKDAYIKQWGEWCRSHPRADWPDWLCEYVDERKRQAKKSQQSAPVGGVGTDVQGLGA